MIPGPSAPACQRHVERAHHELAALAAGTLAAEALAAGTLAAGTPAAGTPAAGTLAAGTRGAGTPRRGPAPGANPAPRSAPGAGLLRVPSGEALAGLGAGPDAASLGLDGRLRDDVVQSWRRSLAVRARIDSLAAPAVLSDDVLRDARSEHPLAEVLSIIRRLLVEPAADAGLIVALGNAAGQLLWVEGDPAAARRAEVMGFVPGADWSEASVGTSAPGAALATGRPMQVSRAEHFHPVVHPWSCSAIPLRDPGDGSIIGVLDLTGGDEAVSPLALPLLGAAASAVELTWQRTGVRRPSGRAVVVPGGPGARLGVPAAGPGDPAAGAPDGQDGPLLLRVTGVLPARLGRDGAALREVSGRHAEILTLLDWHAPGVDGAALEDLLYGRRGQDVTLRAELHRLRRMLAGSTGGGPVGDRGPGPEPGPEPGPDAGRTGAAPEAGAVGLGSRPYRITGPLRTDAGLARDALRRGDLTAALGLAVGPVLPRSEAPGIVEIRGGLQADLREAVLQDAGVDELWAYLARPEAAADADLWMAALRLLPAGSPRRALAVSALERIAADD